MIALFVRSGSVAALVLAVAVVAGCSKAPETTNIQGRVLGYGILKPPAPRTNAPRQLTQGTNSAPRTQLPTISPTTNVIPARIGLSFGMLYEIAGFKTNTDAVELVTVTKFPKMTFPDKSSAIAFTRLTRSPVNNGFTWGISAFTFEHPFELVPGEWQMQVSYGNKTVAQQTFTVYAESVGAVPSPAPAPPAAPAATTGPKAGSGK